MVINADKLFRIWQDSWTQPAPEPFAEMHKSCNSVYLFEIKKKTINFVMTSVLFSPDTAHNEKYSTPISKQLSQILPNMKSTPLQYPNNCHQTQRAILDQWQWSLTILKIQRYSFWFMIFLTNDSIIYKQKHNQISTIRN